MITKYLNIDWIDFFRKTYWNYLSAVNRKYKNVYKIPRHKNFTIKLNDHELEVIDSASFIFMYEEIFVNEIYKFQTKNNLPYFIDGGANIGLASIYIKSIFPNAKILAFEPDPTVFKTLSNNIHSFQLENIKIINKGLWDSNTTLSFESDHADAGRIIDGNKNTTELKITTTKLSPYIDEKVDLLKIDIEGSEFKVLKEIKNKLHLVERIFIEYHSFEGKEQHIHEILSILIGSDFRVTITSPGLTQQNPFTMKVVKHGMDMQLNIFGYRDDLISNN